MTTLTDFPRDSEGFPLAWPDPDQPEWYVDAWNGIYPSRSEALREAVHWTANEAERTLVYGEPIVSEDDRRDPWGEWVTRLHDSEYCAECGGDAEHHVPRVFMGNWFALCKYSPDDEGNYHPIIAEFRRKEEV